VGGAVADRPGGIELAPGIHATVRVKRVDQLRAPGLTADDIGYVAFPHWHEDHTGNANLFGKLDAATGEAGVFGNGMVRRQLMPTHAGTPGAGAPPAARHRPLRLNGDLYHSRENRLLRLVPRINADRAATPASMDRFGAIAAHEHARVVIPHDELPRSPPPGCHDATPEAEGGRTLPPDRPAFACTLRHHACLAKETPMRMHRRSRLAWLTLLPVIAWLSAVRAGTPAASIYTGTLGKNDDAGDLRITLAQQTDGGWSVLPWAVVRKHPGRQRPALP
jgi:hypothetical protein